MKKILVPVDFSSNSRKAIRFALQFASQVASEVLFLNVVNLLLPLSDGAWDLNYFQDNTLRDNEKALSRLVKKTYNKNLPEGIAYKCFCVAGLDVGHEIITFAQKEKVDFICMGSTGMGFLGKLFGTVTTYLMAHSSLPVFVVPKNYSAKPIRDIWYSSDMSNPVPEINKVLDLASQLHAMSGVVHFDYEVGLQENRSKLLETEEKFKKDNLRFRYENLNAMQSLNNQLTKFVVRTKPSMLILFTCQSRKWLDRMLISSNAVDMSFDVKVPLLVFRKEA